MSCQCWSGGTGSWRRVSSVIGEESTGAELRGTAGKEPEPCPLEYRCRKSETVLASPGLYGYSSTPAAKQPHPSANEQEMTQ